MSAPWFWFTCLAAAYPHVIGLWRLSTRASLFAAAGCAIYLTGAAGLESIGYWLLGSGATPQLYRVEVAVEEFFEMVGGSSILYAVLLFCIIDLSLRRHIRSWPRHINLVAPSSKP